MSRPNPFLALRSYTREDAGRFFGRDADLVVVKGRLLSGRSILLFAASGAGKTSFLDARLRPSVEEDWLVIPHRAWAAEAPLAALRTKTSETLAAAGLETGSGDPSIPQMLERAIESRSKAPRRYLFILDQFEEVFQHWRDVSAIDTFAAEVARVTELSTVDARVLFSMREEFLGELSLFDQIIPDLFGNSYRLKSPSRDQCEDIIERTARSIQTKTSEAGLQLLLDDLIGCGPAVPGQPAISSVRNRIALPFLQIVCYRIWEKDVAAAAADAEFLEGYTAGRAEGELRGYCTETLEKLLPGEAERNLASDAFGYLMTRRGAKMAYELENLADHMKRPVGELKAVLEKFSRDDIRILRKFQGGSADSQWFELYHDLYASFLFDWKEKHDLERQAKAEHERYLKIKGEIEEQSRKTARRNALMRRLVYAGIVLTIFVFLGWVLYQDYRNIRKWVNGEPAGVYADAVSSTVVLRNTPFVKDRIRAMWAGHWKDQAEKSARLEDRDAAILYGLMAARMQSDPLLLRELTAWTGGSMQQVVRRVRLPGEASLVNVAADGETVLAFAGGKAYRWPRGADAKWRESAAPLRFREERRGVEQSVKEPYTTEPSPEKIYAMAFSPDGSRVLARAGKRIGMFSSETGQMIWELPADAAGRRYAGFSPDGTWAVIASSLPGTVVQHSVQLCGAASNYAKCIPLAAKARALPTFSPDSKELAIAEPSGTVSLWSVATQVGTGKFYSDEAVLVLYLSEDQIALVRQAGATAAHRRREVEIFRRQKGAWVSDKSFVIPFFSSISYLARRHAFGVIDFSGSVELLDFSGNSVLKRDWTRDRVDDRFTADPGLITARASVLTEWSLRDEVAAGGLRISDDVFQNINADGTAFVTSNDTGTYLRQLRDPAIGKLAGAPIPDEVEFSPSGRRLFTRVPEKVVFFTLNPLRAIATLDTRGLLSAEVSWASDDLVRITEAAGLVTQLVDANSGVQRYQCVTCADMQLSPSQDLIELDGKGTKSIRFKRKQGAGWEAGGDLKNSNGIDAISLRGGKLLGIHANQFRIWDLAQPDQDPQVVRTSDSLKFAEAGLFSSDYVTVSETGELNLWPVKDPSRYRYSAKLAAVDELLPLAQGDGAAIVGDGWVHVITESAGRIEFTSRPVNGIAVSGTLRATREGMRIAVRRGSATIITDLMKTDLSDLAPFAPPAGKTWTDVLDTWTQRLDLSVNTKGKLSGTNSKN